MKQLRLDQPLQAFLKYQELSIPSMPHLTLGAPSPLIQNHPSSTENMLQILVRYVLEYIKNNTNRTRVQQ